MSRSRGATRIPLQRLGYEPIPRHNTQPAPRLRAGERGEVRVMMDIRAFEAELEKLRSGFSFDTTKPCGMYVAALTRAEAAEARAAELESQLAAQQWRPIDEPAPKGEIEVKMRCAVTDDGGVYKIRTDIFVGWWTSADDSEWRPLPPAPQEPTQ